MSAPAAAPVRPDPVSAELAAALCRWLPARRWSGLAGRTVSHVETLAWIPIAPAGGAETADGALVVLAAHLDDGETVRLHVPLGRRRDASAVPDEDLVLWTGRHWVFDATADPELMRRLVAMIRRGDRGPELVCTAERSPYWRPGRAATGVRRLDGEQSNTSLVIDGRMILKLFRRPGPGLNPELEVQRRLRADAGMPIPALLGAAEARLSGGLATLAVLTRYVPGAVDGWHLLLDDLAGPERGGAAISAAVRELGATVAGMHRRLAVAFGSARLTDELRAGLHTDLTRRLNEAAGVAPSLRLYLPALRGVLARAVAGPPAGHVQRVHGDLHLGQVLRSDGRWLVIDFEGEPAAPAVDRVAWRSPWQDVAGMLRSLDYAAGHAVLEGVVPVVPARAWVSRLRGEFLAGYTAAAGAVGGALLGAYEVDKAVYEVVYELRNRPGWTDIPMAAVHRLAGSSSRPQPGERVSARSGSTSSGVAGSGQVEEGSFSGD
ncbi:MULTISPECIES: phosphotransferase [Catenuloplanes]|uniref:Maltokinase n=1 Tax=Catenuloplanes niger TaxID=587534 RepID=A0AAE3ZWZ1_9ACTN|nr:phosphotransferase [Catenuloplanes niger]MDR7327558.1 maltokinase [Catenuloplanes niger]